MFTNPKVITRMCVPIFANAKRTCPAASPNPSKRGGKIAEQVLYILWYIMRPSFSNCLIFYIYISELTPFINDKKGLLSVIFRLRSIQVFWAAMCIFYFNSGANIIQKIFVFMFLYSFLLLMLIFNFMAFAAFSFFSSTTLAYICVVFTLVCPNILLAV